MGGGVANYVAFTLLEEPASNSASGSAQHNRERHIIRIYRCGPKVAVAKHLADLDQVPAQAQHLAGKRMAEAMTANAQQPSAAAGAVHDVRDGAGVDGTMGNLQGQEHVRTVGSRAALCEVGHERLTNLDRKRGTIRATAFASHAKLSGAPVNVPQLQRRHLARAHAKTRQQAEDGPVPQPAGTRAVATVEQSAYR